MLAADLAYLVASA